MDLIPILDENERLDLNWDLFSSNEEHDIFDNQMKRLFENNNRIEDFNYCRERALNDHQIISESVGGNEAYNLDDILHVPSPISPLPPTPPQSPPQSPPPPSVEVEVEAETELCSHEVKIEPMEVVVEAQVVAVFDVVKPKGKRGRPPIADPKERLRRRRSREVIAQRKQRMKKKKEWKDICESFNRLKIKRTQNNKKLESIGNELKSYINFFEKNPKTIPAEMFDKYKTSLNVVKSVLKF